MNEMLQYISTVYIYIYYLHLTPCCCNSCTCPRWLIEDYFGSRGFEEQIKPSALRAPHLVQDVGRILVTNHVDSVSGNCELLIIQLDAVASLENSKRTIIHLID